LVVDMSGSMRNRDVTAGSTRAQAVYENLAQYFVKAQLDSRKGHAKNSRMLDVVSLIEMRDTSTIIFEALPLDSHLFNVLMQRKTAKPFSHGKYLPSLDSAEQLLNTNIEKIAHSICHLNLNLYKLHETFKFHELNKSSQCHKLMSS